jgi:MFS family permease
MNGSRRNIFVLIFLAFTGAVGIALFRPTLPIYTRRMGATGFEVGALASGFMLARALCAYLCGRFSDRIQRRKLFLPLSFLFYLFSCVGLFFARSYSDVLIIGIFQGAISGMMWPMAQVVAIESTVQALKTRVLSFYFAAGNAGAMPSLALRSFLSCSGSVPMRARHSGISSCFPELFSSLDFCARFSFRRLPGRQSEEVMREKIGVAG